MTESSSIINPIIPISVNELSVNYLSILMFDQANLFNYILRDDNIKPFINPKPLPNSLAHVWMSVGRVQKYF